MKNGFPTLRLELNSRPESPALVRAAVTGLAELLAFDSELFEDLRIAVSEACNNVVMHAYDGEPGPLVVGLEIEPAWVEVKVRDWGGGIQHVEQSDDRMGVGLAVISALADRAEFISAAGGGTEVRMAFIGPDAAVDEFERRPIDGGPDAGDPVLLSGDVVVTLTPVDLLGGVLGRLTRAVAARAHFTVDRLCEVSLVTDAIGSFANTAASGATISFALLAGRRRVELIVGPVRPGSGGRLEDAGLPDAPLAQLVSEVSVEAIDGIEILHVVVTACEESRAVQ